MFVVVCCFFSSWLGVLLGRYVARRERASLSRNSCLFVCLFVAFPPVARVLCDFSGWCVVEIVRMGYGMDVMWVGRYVVGSERLTD